MQASPAQINAQLRQALLATAPRMRKNVGTFTNNAGGTSRIKLFNVGILTLLQLAVTVTLTIGNGANAIASAKGPWNMISKVRVTDYDGTDRVNLSGFQLFQINCVRYREPFGFNNSGMGAIFANPQQPLAQGNQTVRFLINVPIAYDPESDLRGCILAQTAVGEMYLNIDWNKNYVAANDDALYNSTNSAATVVANGNPEISVQVWQHYLLPQAIGPKAQYPLPPLDLMTVYELLGNQIATDNIVANTERLFNYPNVRTVIGAFTSYMVAGTTLAKLGDTLQHRLIVNGNNVMRDESELSKYFNQRVYTHGDISSGVFYLPHRDKPIETALFGNVQMGITPVNAGANSYFETMFESFYTKGTTLPGLQQAAS